MNYLGVDLHKRYSYVTKTDGKGNVLEQTKVRNKEDELMNYFSNLEAETKVAMEATCNWYYFYELLEENFEVSLANPLKTKAIASARIKTDKIDSKILADLLRADLLPTSYIPTRKTRDQREVLRLRASLVSMRVGVKNRVHAILAKLNLIPPVTDIFGKKGTVWLKELKLRDCYRQELDIYLELIEKLNELIERVTLTIKALAEADPRAIILMTMPGISYYSALLILSEIGDINRFKQASQLTSYAGLVPSVYSSGGKTHYGSIAKQGSRRLRWILVELSTHAVKGSKKFEDLHIRVAAKHGKAAARVAVAREMLKVIFYMLKRGEPFMKDYSRQGNLAAISLVS
ncbi:MAG: IS110 family transposase [Actinomycetota bacterium]|nr:IS110 family transposase [Actinomycetota bacterium]